MTKEAIQKRIGAVVVFFVIAVSIRYATNQTNFLSIIHNDFLKIVIQGVGPTVGAIVAFLAFSIKPTLSFSGIYKQKWLPWLVFWILPVMVFVVFSFVLHGKPNFMVVAILLYALLEEIGWRGFLQPALSFLPKFTSLLIVTVLWFIWHLNFDMTQANVTFFLILLGGSWGMRAVADRTQSIIAVSAFHATYDIYAATGNKSSLVPIILGSIFVIWVLTVIFSNKLGVLKQEAIPEVS
jgi:hypothetical protein